MVSIKFPRLSLLLILPAAIFLVALASCARKISFLTSPAVPAAQGSVKIKKDNNSNYSINIQLSNLAESKRLQPSKEAYVVWMIANQGITKNLGQIKTSSGLFSNKLKASFETVTPYKPVKIFITAENDPDVLYPGMQVVLTTNNF